MNADLLKDTIANTDIKEMNSDTFKSFELMLKIDTFKTYHNILQEKIEKYKKFVKYVNNVKTIEITPTLGDFYKTLNGTIVMIIDIEPVKKLAQCLIVKGGIDKDDYLKLEPILMIQSKLECIGGAFVIDNKGKFIGQEANEKFSLHIANKLNPNFTENADENKA